MDRDNENLVQDKKTNLEQETIVQTSSQPNLVEQIAVNFNQHEDNQQVMNILFYLV
jgi:hypothetical protein